MSERAESVAESVNKKVAPKENIQLEEQAPLPPYDNSKVGRPSLDQTPGPATQPTQLMATNVLIRSLAVVGYCTLVALCTAYGYTNIRTLTHSDGSSTLVDALYSGVIGGTVLGVPFIRKGGILDKYLNRWKLCNIHIACGRLRRSALEFLLCTFLTLLMCWSALVVGFSIQKIPIVLVGNPDMMPLLEHMAYDWYTGSIGVLTFFSMTSVLAIWVLVKEPRISYNLEEDRFKLIVIGVLWTCFLTRVCGSAPLVYLLVAWILPKKLTDKFVLESDKLRAADQASAEI